MKTVLDILKESIDERKLSRKSMDKVKKASDDLARKVYGDKYGEYNLRDSDFYGVDVTNDTDIPSGLFSIGNKKLSDDTLIINFTSALGCPSMMDCPITQRACYAVAGENRLPDTRRKNLMVQNLVKAARANDMIDGVLDIAKIYVEELKNSPKPIKFVRFNEAGDFPDAKTAVAAAKFAKWARDNYGIMSMAYTAKLGIDFANLTIDGEPLDKIMKINRSIETIPHSEGNVNQKFFGIPMVIGKPDINLENNDKTETVSDELLKSKLEVVPPLANKNGIKSIPQLRWGNWNGGNGWYYVCPCSFWKNNKDRAEFKYYQSIGLLNAEDIPEDANERDNLRDNLRKQLSTEQSSALKKILNGIKSPCGTECAVCHDIQGGVTPDGQKNVTDYAVLTATHGAGKGNYNSDYAQLKRQGKDATYSKDNKHGIEKKYGEGRFNPAFKEKYSQKRADAIAKKNASPETEKQINEIRTKFFDFLNRMDQ